MDIKIVNFFFLFVFYQMSTLISAEVKTGYVKIENSNLLLNVEIADTQERRKKGLMYREFLDEDKGMVFVFPEEDFLSVWMKNTKINLDIIFISKNYIIIDYFENISSMSEKIYTSRKKSKYILEINSGLIKKFKIKKGDKIKIEY